MKRVRIDFTQRRPWLGVWVAACLLTGLMAGAVVVKVRALDQATRDIEARGVQIAAQALALRTAADKLLAAQAADPRTARLRDINELLRLDWNPAFATIENLQLPGARIVQVSFNAASEAIRIEYEVETVAQASALTSALNDGLATPAWRLESVTGAAAASPVASKMRASWATQLEALR